jgi:ubiquinone/menaquinone biosynthesis C-methylase UbiE
MIGRQLQRPSGLSGRLTGALMRMVNAKPNRMAVEALRVEPQDVVLELGFGPGHAIAMLAAQAKTGLVYGVDQSPVMLEQAQTRNRHAIDAGRVFLYEAPFERLPFWQASVDKILAVNVIYFWHDVPAVLQEIRRVLRPGGRIVIYATDASTMRRWKFAGPETHRLFSASELTAILRQGGFDGHHVEVSNIRVAKGIDGLIATISNPMRHPGDTSR